MTINKFTNKNISSSITNVVVFFDLFNYPLTVFEIWKNLNIKCSLLDVKKILEDENFSGHIQVYNGFYFLKGRQDIIKIRMARYNYTDRKFKRAMKISKIFRFIPWIEMIAIGNNIGEHNLKNNSDIDFFIITKQNRIWITRFFCVMIVKLLRLRPTEKNTKDTICLSFFISKDRMDLDRLMLDNNDIYFIHWLSGLVPIYDAGAVYKKFIHSNRWIYKYLPNWRPAQISKKRNLTKLPSFVYYDLIDLLFGWLEERIKKIQLKKLPDSIKKEMNKNTNIVINDQILKFHTNDRRKGYRDKFKENMFKIN